MYIYLYENTKITSFLLPARKIGDFWLKNSKNVNMVNIVAEDGKWMLLPSKHTKIYDAAGNTENIVLKIKSYYIVEKEDQRFLMYCDYSDDRSYKNYMVKEGTPITIGSEQTCNIYIPLSNILPEHIKIVFQQGSWILMATEKAVCYLNDRRIKKNKIICSNGDLINIYGIKILLIHGSLFINNPFNNIVVQGLELINYVIEDELTDEEIEDKPIYGDNDYFSKSPRVRSAVTTYYLNIDPPPAKDNMDEVPLWTTLAPMVTMLASTMVSLLNTMDEYLEGIKTFKEILPTLFISGCMVFTMFIWPNINRKMQAKNKKAKEEVRQTKYRRYLDGKKRELSLEYDNQKRIIEDNVLSTDICYDMIMNKRRILWSRRNDQDDFLDVRVGTGDVPLDITISYEEEELKMDESDDLKTMVEKLVKSYRTINDVPMSYSFRKNILTGINGLFPKYITFTNNMLLQLMSFHSYDELKIVVFTNENNKDRWDYIANSPYCFSDDKSIRFFATKPDEIQDVSNYLEQVFTARESAKGANVANIQNGYYLVIVDVIDDVRKMPILRKILKEKNNLGFSLIILEEKLSKVPSEVTNFLVIGEKTSVILDATTGEQNKFIEESKDTYDMKACVKILSNLPLYKEENDKQLPSSITFLETFGVGKVEQLNVLNRWKENNPTKSLKAEIGANLNGEAFILDLHEKVHGPHGLVAGMTGSGKSEFIITYVLSMAVNYSPEEVQFVLIDYKGGGLASAFVDSETGKKIPHIAGTITNLDKSEINRALASINSELKRRQAVFNDVKMQTGEGTIDIYKYQRLYRDGVIREPMSHLIIVCDEFAELKAQQPDFMNDLVSAARIGRSLGVHLILATQKPSGVVDAQIWSNAKFKVCLKVQDKQDSNEMIRNDLAAELKQVGRFYLLVGYSEFFSTGQSAWAGAQYFPDDEFKKTVDKNLYLIDNIGSVSRAINNSDSKKKIMSQGDELTNIVKYLIDSGEKEKSFKLKQLWLEKIPELIYVDELKKKYKYARKDYNINPIIGEYDSPASQTQNLLTINFPEEGNTLVYGMSEAGKDEFFQTLVYSMIDTYSTDEVNIYLIDFGAETLINYLDAPQVGDVVLSSDDEKLYNLIKYLYATMTKRKKMFTQYGGNYSGYIQHSGEKMPSIVVCINSIDIMNELYAEILEKYISVIREGAKYGIYFVISAEAPGAVKSKIVQACKNTICLQLNNEAQYRDVLGRTNGVVPSQILGRGLVKREEVCEFQTATVAKDKQFYNFIKSYIEELKSKGYKKAQKIYIMPETVELEPMKSKFTGIDNVPIGIYKDNLNIAFYDFGKKVFNVISSSEFENFNSIIKNLVHVFSNNNDFFNTTIIDASNYYEEYEGRIPCVNGNFNEFVDSLERINKTFRSMLKANMKFSELSYIPNNAIIIIGFEKFYNKLDDEHKKIFQNILIENSEESKLNFIVFDVPAALKKYEYDEWYKKSIDNSNGIWIGPGISQQFLIKTMSISAAISSVDIEYGVIIKNGSASTFKMINEIK